MRLLIGIAAGILLVIVLRDFFETVILPRRVHRRFRLTTLFYRTSWFFWRGATTHFGTRREVSLSWFGPFSLLMLLALWALGIIVAFATFQWALGSNLLLQSQRSPGFLDDLYLSGTNFFTLGLGDVLPHTTIAKILTVTESGLGFAFLAITIGYLPVIYQAFSRREIAISLLDARSGSPPTAGELLKRQPVDSDPEGLMRLLCEWERWAAELLESHLSYPVLAYFRSQHGNQSWLATLATILDTSAILAVGCDGPCARQAHLTFAIARHAVVDLAQVFSAPRPVKLGGRLTPADLTQLIEELGPAGKAFGAVDARARFSERRLMYEPYLRALSDHLALPLPGWSRRVEHPDNWEGAPWKNLAVEPEAMEHFE